jgi:hypothetical protein
VPQNPIFHEPRGVVALQWSGFLCAHFSGDSEVSSEPERAHSPVYPADRLVIIDKPSHHEWRGRYHEPRYYVPAETKKIDLEECPKNSHADEHRHRPTVSKIYHQCIIYDY